MTTNDFHVESSPDGSEVRCEVVVGAAVGLHARPASQFVKAARSYGCELLVGRPGGELVDAKSLLKVLGLGAGHGERLVLVARGPDGPAALGELGERVARREE